MLTATGPMLDTRPEEQARRFWNWFRRLPSRISIEDGFKQWSSGKDFSLLEQKEILMSVLRLFEEDMGGTFDPLMSMRVDQLIEGLKL